MKKIPKTMLIMLFIISALVLMTSCTTNRITKTKTKVKNSTEFTTQVEQKETETAQVVTEITKEPTEETETPTEVVDIPEDSFATIVSFGDTLCHKPLFNAAYNKETGIYDFSSMFKYVEKYFKNSTINIGNCESPMAGAEKGYSGYPRFNAPEHLAIDLKELGVDIMTTANNHSLDKGFSGLESTLNFLDESEIAHVGTSRTEEEQNTILFKELNGIKTAFLAYTYGTNGISVPKDKKFCINLINKDFMLKQINQAKEEGAELIVVSMHWGIEYQITENAEQDKLAEFLIKNGVDIILGSHPHVLQPMKMLKVETNKGEEKEGLVIFSQGNFFSNQSKKNTQNTAIFNIQVKKSGETGEDEWSEKMYKLALKERERCIKIIGPEIESKIKK